MDVRNCRMCGKLFNYVDKAVCPNCEKELEKKFYEAKEFIYDNPGCSMDDVAEAVELPLKQIKSWVRQERLSFVSSADGSIICEQCGAPIDSGRFCKSCKDKLSGQLDNMFEKPVAPPKKKPQDTSAKMRFMGRDN